MIIISDTSPLSALAEIGELDLLRRLYGRVVIPETVRRECLHPHSPPAVAAAIESADSFFDVTADPVLLPEAGNVDPGEAAAISLAWQHRETATLIIDDRDGRNLCDALGLRKTGTAGVLFEASMTGLVDFDKVMVKLQATTFRLSQTVVSDLRARWLDKKQAGRLPIADELP